MTRRILGASLIASSAWLLAMAGEGAAQHITINVGPPPPIVVAAPPQLVLVPGTAVYYAPGVSVNLFAYQGRYYSFHNDHWFMATAPGRPWTYVPVARVPGRVRAVPVRYYKTPPGHAQKMAAPHRGERGERHGKGHRD